MKKFLAFSLISSSLIFNIQQAKADWDYWGFKVEEETVNGFSGYFQNLYTINSNTGEGTLRKRFCGNDSCYNTTGFPLIRDRSDIAYPENHIDKDTFILREYETTSVKGNHYFSILGIELGYFELLFGYRRLQFEYKDFKRDSLGTTVILDTVYKISGGYKIFGIGFSF